MVVYVDLVFLTNMAIDGAVLLATAKARRLQAGRVRLFGAAAVGGTYAASLFWVDVPGLYSMVSKVAVSLLMIVLAFGYGGLARFVRNVGAFYGFSFATLGGVVGLGFLLQSSGSPWGAMTLTEGGGIVVTYQMQAFMLAVDFILALWLYRGTAETKRRRDQLERLLWDAVISVSEETWSVRALLDTGNRLYDPLTRIPVIIMESSVWRDRLPAAWGDRLKGESADRLVAELDDLSSDGFPWADRLRLVPYRAVNGGSRMMLALKPDAVELAREGAAPLRFTRVLIGLDGGTLSSDGSYRAILHPDLVLDGAAPPAPSQPA